LHLLAGYRAIGLSGYRAFHLGIDEGIDLRTHNAACDSE